MFGKPGWFRKKTVGWGLRVASWKGWLYVVVWAGVICVPFIGLLLSHRWLESLVWAVVMMAALVGDVRQIRREMEAGTPADVSEVLVIDENTEPDPSYFAPRSCNLHTRR